MGLTFDLDPPILHWTSVGDVPHAEGMQVTRQSFEAIEATGERGWHILADLTLSAENRSGDELRGIAATVAAQGSLLSGRIATVVAKPLLHGTSRMFAAYMDEYGVEVRLFSTVEDARAWLLATKVHGAAGD